MAEHARTRPDGLGRAPGVIVGAAIAVAVIVGFIGGLMFTELTGDDEPDGSTPETSALEDLAALEEATENAPPCTEVFAPGRPVAEVLAANDAGPCTGTDADDLRIEVVVSWDCPDGTKVHQVGDWGWGRDGQTWQGPDVPEPYADCVLPGADAQHP